jgi:hypothetical protein
MERLLKLAEPFGSHTFVGSSAGKSVRADVILFETTNAKLREFLESYRWLESDYGENERPIDTSLQLEFLVKQQHGIVSWLIVAPQRKESFGAPLEIDRVGKLAVKKRRRVASRGFQVFGEPVHRRFAEFLADVGLGASELTTVGQSVWDLRNSHRGVCLVYPVREATADEVSIGFELLFPKNGLPFDMNFTVRRKSESDAIVVPSPTTNV